MADLSSKGLLSPLLQRARLSAARPHFRVQVLYRKSGNGGLAALVPPGSYAGVDRDSDFLEVAWPRFPNHNFPPEIPCDRRFDRIVALATLEHLKEPAPTRAAGPRRLIPAGRMLLTTPPRRFRIVHDLGSRLRIFSPARRMSRKRCSTWPELAGLVTSIGLEVVEYWRFRDGADQFLVVAR